MQFTTCWFYIFLFVETDIFLNGVKFHLIFKVFFSLYIIISECNIKTMIQISKPQVCY